MAASTTLTIRVSPELKEKLGKLAAVTRRSNSFLAAEALSAFVDRELEIMAGIMEGIEDMENGDLVPHEEAMAQLNAVIETARRKTA